MPAGHRPSHVKVDEIDNLCVNFGRLGCLMDSVFSTLHRKRGAINEEKISILNSDLELVRIKWHVMILSLDPKFHVLHEHVPDLLWN